MNTYAVVHRPSASVLYEGTYTDCLNYFHGCGIQFQELDIYEL